MTARYSVIHRDQRDVLGEGPIWLSDRSELAWVDILAPAVHRLCLTTGEIASLAFDEPVGWVLPRADMKTVVAGFQSGFWILDLDTGARVHLSNPEPDRPGNRLNDAKVDRWGRIWAGSKSDADDSASGALYCLDHDHGCRRMDDGYQVTNGPTFSADGMTMYHSDSAARIIYAFDIASDGALGRKREWLTFEDHWGYPDGMTTDAEGYIWIAHWDGGAISRFDPDARLVESIQLPTKNITSCTFAGDDLSRLFVTSAAFDNFEDPLAGALFEVDARVSGLTAQKFAG